MTDTKSNFTNNLGSKLWMPPTPDVITEFIQHENLNSGIRATINQNEEDFVSEGKASEYIVKIKKRLKFCRDTNTGFSLIRLGDGEGNVLSNKRISHHQHLLQYTLEKISHLHFGELDVVYKNRFKFSNLIYEAAANADFVGIPDKDALSRNYNKPENELDIRACIGIHYSRAIGKTIRADRAVNWWIARSLLTHYEEIINQYEKLYLVTNHLELASAAKRRFMPSTCELIPVPDQAKNQKYKHKNNNFYPEQYIQLLESLPYAPNSLFLVGAGLLGKPICNQIKRFKGHAIDVGSMFDIWAGLATRPGVDATLINKHSWIQ